MRLFILKRPDRAGEAGEVQKQISRTFSGALKRAQDALSDKRKRVLTLERGDEGGWDGDEDEDERSGAILHFNRRTIPLAKMERRSG